MAEKLIRVGKISSINTASGTVRVTYPDRDDSVTAEIPMFSMYGEFKQLKVGADVLVLHLSNGAAAGICMGLYNNESNPPANPSAIWRKELGDSNGDAYMEFSDGNLTIHAASITLDGNVTGTADITAQGKSLAGHVHNTPSGMSGGPV